MAQTSTRGSMTSAGRRRLRPGLVLGILLLVHLVASVFGTVPGCLSVDEGIYRWMAKDFAATGSWEIRTGYSDLPSPESTHPFLPAHDGHTYPRYPYLFAVLAYPFYQLAGFTGLFLLNNLAFILTTWLVFRVTRELLDSAAIALVASLMLPLSTYAWEYSQAAWPHALTGLFVFGAFVLALAGLRGSSSKALRSLFAAGVVAGFAPGLRLDAILVLPSILALCLFHRPSKPRAALAVVVGSLPGLAILALTNRAKFGTAWPFSYGEERSAVSAHFSPVVAIAALAVSLAAWILTRKRSSGRGNRAAGLAILAVAALGLVAVPSARRATFRAAHTAYAMVVDLSAYRSDRVEAALQRSPGGGVVYLDGQKQALLQGMPWLALLLLPLVRIVRRGASAGRLAALLIVPAAYLAFYALLYPDHGGLGLNLRYLVPVLPFLCILGAWAGHELWTALRGGLAANDRRLAIPAAGVAVVSTIAISVALRGPHPAAQRLEFLVLRAPLLLAGLLAVLLGVFAASPNRSPRALTRTTGIVLAIAFAWSFTISIPYDFTHHRRQRAINREIGRVVAERVPAGAVLFTEPYIDPFLALVETPGVRLAFPGQDRYQDFPRLLEGHLSAGRPVYAVFRVAEWNRLEPEVLKSRTVTPIASFQETLENGPNLAFAGDGFVATNSLGKRFVLASIK